MKNENKITIVTAFFPINRDNWAGFGRSNQKYYDWFEFWANIQNDLIIYTDQESKKYVEDIRIKKYGRKNTKIIVIDDYTTIDVEFYESIKKATENDLNKKFHIYENNPESWNTNYNYLMNLKSWFVTDAIKNHNVKGMISWLDFGFNHGGEYYTKHEEFNFLWDYKFSDKMHFFNVNDIDDIPIFHSIKMMSTYIQGCVIVSPDNLWQELWKSVRNNILFLNKTGLMDDDQIFYLYFYKEFPEKCELHKSKWFDIFEQFSSQKFTVIENTSQKESYIKKLKSKVKWKLTLINYVLKWYKIMNNEKFKG